MGVLGVTRARARAPERRPTARAIRRRQLRGMVALLRPYKGRVALALLALLAATASALTPPPLARAAIDEGITPKDYGVLQLVVVLFVASALVNWVATYAQTYLVGWVGQRALQDLRIQIFAHLQRLSIDFYGRRQAGVVISRITNDVQALDQLVSEGVVTLISSSLLLIGTTVILLTLDVELALITFAIFPLLMVASIVFRIAAAGAYRLTRERVATLTAYLQETLSGVRVVRAFGQEPRHVEQFARLNADNRAANLKTVHLNAAYFPAVELLAAIATTAILLIGGYSAIKGGPDAVTIGVLVAFIAALSNFFDPIQQLSNLYTVYQSGMAALDKIFELLDEEPDLVDKPGAPALGRLRGEIAFDGVSFAYPGAETPALDEVSLMIASGETVALVGATGAGKSTLAKLVARFHDPTAGRVLVDGHDLRDVAARSLRSQLGIVPQDAFLFSGTLRENITFGRPDADAADIEAALRALGAEAFLDDLPDGLETTIGERGVQLSAGQRQLVAFARALVADPRILVLDEATANVDARTERRIDAALRTLLDGRTALVIAHRLSTIRDADRIAVLEDGRVVELGTHEELLDAGGAYARMHADWAAGTA